MNRIAETIRSSRRRAAGKPCVDIDALPCGGIARLRLPRRTLHGLEARIAEADGLCRGGMECGEALESLRRARFLMIRAMEQVRAASPRLPACGGVPRILPLAERLLSGGDSPLDARALDEAVRAFDAERALTQRELWALPDALRAAALIACAACARDAVSSGRAAAAAEKWARDPKGRRFSAEPAFIERALMLPADDIHPRARVRLASGLRAHGLSAERAARLSQEARARDRVRLDNLASSLRTIEETDWLRWFERVSPVERALRRDPSGVYPLMDDTSRQRVRDAVTQISRASGLGEAAVARHAVAAARDARGERPACPDIESLSREAFDSGNALREGVCWWLMDDEGRSALNKRMDTPGTHPGRVVPDPSGSRVMALFSLLAAGIGALFMALAGHPALWPACLILGFCCAEQAAARVSPLIAGPARLLKLEIERLPDAFRTLIVTPVLLADLKRAEAACDNLEALGALEDDPNLCLLLLGDFADADAPDMPGDAEIAARVRERIAEMNAREGRERCFYLQRPRTLLAADNRWMGKDRKRGALMDLNRVLLGESGAEAAFSVEGRACADLAGRFRYVITLDEDTRMLPGTAQALVGAMAHPLNRPMKHRGYAVMQPRMEPLPSACVNEFCRAFTGPGGVDAYPVAASSLWMDLTGTGVYAGKGIYDVAAFHAALDGALPEGRILSHDLIEGAVARAAYLNDIALYDGCPATLGGWTRRAHRWTRGDWQLIPLIFAPGPLPNGRKLRAVDRFRMLGNLLTSLRAPSMCALLLACAWTGDTGALVPALIAGALPFALHPLDRDPMKGRRTLARLATLPLFAHNALDASLRAAWRVLISGKRLMEWVPSASADAPSGDKRLSLPGRALALACLPGLLLPDARLLAAGLILVFWFGADWVRNMERVPCAPSPEPDDADRAFLIDLARDTWRFFEAAVPLSDGLSLPPDNLQIDPPTAPARRTSPTNIGLYLLSCVSARRLGLIDDAALRLRVERTLNALDAAEKWRGHLFNWIDIDTLEPLRPRYVSSVDSGNLAACALACARALDGMDPLLSQKLRDLAEHMDFSALYDPKRELFLIGMDVEAGRLSEAHYDLMASEARILSFTAIALRAVPARHWKRLGRACVRSGGGAALASWSGTMFEYLMPEILMPAPAMSLAGTSCRAAIRAQIRHGQRRGRPWGVSESGYHAFDGGMSYQYRAFGLSELALDGTNAPGNVVAPYAAALALPLLPREACDNLRAMSRLGWRGEFGFYEAADYQRPGPDGVPEIVRSHMAHHQGMALCALCNALTGGSIARDFMEGPRMRALSILLEERPATAARKKRERPCPGCDGQASARDTRRTLRGGAGESIHLLAGRRAFALIGMDGGVHYVRHGIEATRLSEGLVNPRAAARLILKNAETGQSEAVSGADWRAECDAGSLAFSRRLGNIEVRAALSLSPEDDTLFWHVRFMNAGRSPVRVSALHVVPASLTQGRARQAHPAFQDIFVTAERLGECGLMLRRRAKDPGEDAPMLLHMARSREPVEIDGDFDAIFGRSGATDRPDSLGEPGARLGAVLNPVSALRTCALIEPGESAEIHFALALVDADANPTEWLERCLRPELPLRAAQLGRARAEAALGFLGLDARAYHLTSRAAALIADPRLAARAKACHAEEAGARRDELWALGLSGDDPIALMRFTDAAHIQNARTLVGMHALWRLSGLACDLVLIDDCPGGYAQPGRDLLDSLLAIAPGKAEERRVWVLDGGALSTEARRTLIRFAAIALESAIPLNAQLGGLLERLTRKYPNPVGLVLGRAILPRHENRTFDNGFGGFIPGGYEIDITADAPTPAPWCDILASEDMGILLTERGGSFIWHENSRFKRLTPWHGDPLWEGWGLMLWLIHPRTGEILRLLPGDRPKLPFSARFYPDRAAYRFEAEALSGETAFQLSRDGSAILIDVRLENRKLPPDGWRVVCGVNWLMGAEARDIASLSAWASEGACFATGATDGVGWLTCRSTGAESGAALGIASVLAAADAVSGMHYAAFTGAPARLGGDAIHACFTLGWSPDIPGAAEAARKSGGLEPAPAAENAITIETPDPALNAMANTFLLHQVRAARVLGRTGLYQPGGAYGFRDQLQDMLALIPSEPRRVREHLLLCAARQFEDGDAMHWWHMPATGVRTRISDDRLFLPWVTAAYVRETGDHGVLDEIVPYLEDVPIPEGREDVYREMRPGQTAEPLHGHCMRAFMSVKTGEHGLALMGTGDWNDGMNRVGAKGRGESVWLSEFLAACAEAYADILPEGGDREALNDLARRHREAVERFGWDGKWYRRAYDDAGQPLGSRDSACCRIDLIAQAWAVLSGLDRERSKQAMDAAWEALVDERHGVIQLLDPPFDGDGGADPGYIRGYPGGVRENGGQYTHAACWYLIALIRMGDAARAHKALSMLLPSGHADTPEKARRYRVEPYVVAADIHTLPGRTGRGGWTWYTGSAAWLYRAILELLGYERRGDRVRLNALLGDWPEVSLTLRAGRSRYRLVCDKAARRVALDGRAVDDTCIQLIDDGEDHEARFPPREA